MQTILVTGGSGYIGSHTVLELLNKNYKVVVVDNLSNSSYESLRRVQKITGKEVIFYEENIANEDGMDKTLGIAKRDFNGLCFVNLVDFDMVYGHRNNVEGYARAMTAFDKRLGELLPLLREDDLLIITADHGCDPSTPSTDHSREYTPMLAYGKKFKKDYNLGTRASFADIGATVLEYFGLPTEQITGESFLKEIVND